jgi:hypothetical protein
MKFHYIAYIFRVDVSKFEEEAGSMRIEIRGKETCRE